MTNGGNIETITEANGAFLQTTYGNGILKHLPIEYTDKSGGKWKWNYDVAANLIKRTNPVNTQTLFEYVDGFLKSITSAAKSKICFEYDSFFNLSKATASNGYEIDYTFNILGDCIKHADSRGNVRKIIYNILSLPEEIYEPDGNIRYLSYDTEGNVIKTKDKQSQVIFRYDFLNHLVVKIDAEKGLQFRYDTEGNFTELINQNNEKYVFELDAADNVIKEIGFDGIIRRYTRNAAGHVINIERPGNKFTKYEYNEIGNINTGNLPRFII